MSAKKTNFLSEENTVFRCHNQQQEKVNEIIDIFLLESCAIVRNEYKMHDNKRKKKEMKTNKIE